MVTVRGSCLISYHASDECQGTSDLPAGKEKVTFGKIPADSHIGGDVLSGVDAEVGGAHSMHGGLKIMRGIINTKDVGNNNKKKKLQNMVNVLFVL